MNGSSLDSATRVVLRPTASALPVGFLALAVGSFVLSGQQLHWVPTDQQHPAALCLLVFVVPLQATSAVFGLLDCDGIAGTGMALLTGSWSAIGIVLLTGSPGRASGSLGLLLLAAAGALLTPALTAFTTKPLAGTVITVTILRFAAAGIYELTDSAGWRTATALIGLLLSVVAWYAAMAFLLEDVRHHPVLPTFRRGRPAGDADAAAAESDIAALPVEAGVRSPA